MESGNLKAVVVATVVIIGISSASLLLMLNSDNPNVIPNSSGITTLTICGNSSDLLYPELTEATFALLENGSWEVTANFMNDSAGYYENLEIYDRSFMITTDEIELIGEALYEGLDKTFTSNTSALALLDASPSIWYEIQITYSDGSWIYLTAFQTEQGHIISNSGEGILNTNLLEGIVLEPFSALDYLITTIHTLFSTHLD